MSLIKLATFREMNKSEKKRLYEYNKVNKGKAIGLGGLGGAVGGVLGYGLASLVTKQHPSNKDLMIMSAATGTGGAIGAALGNHHLLHRLKNKDSHVIMSDTVIKRLRERRDPHDNRLVWY